MLSNGFGSVSQASLENGLGINSGTLDGALEFAEECEENPKTASNATEGSAVKITGSASVGDKINFSYAFISNDYTPYADYSFYTLNDQTFALGAIGDNVENFGQIQGAIDYTFDEDDFEDGVSGAYSIGFGVVDSKDKVVDSYLRSQISGSMMDRHDSDDEEEDGTVDYQFDYQLYGAVEEGIYNESEYLI